jgi:fatty-acyl-CoA synthase
MTGADLVMPQMFLQAEPLSAMIAQHRPTLSAGVPTIWSDLLRYTQTHGVDLSSLRMITAGGAAVPRQLIERFHDELGIEMVQGWGMTETSPLCSLALPPRGTPPEEEMDWRAKTGRIVPGVEVRIAADDGSILPNDGKSVGEFEVRGPWITGTYYGEPCPDRFHDGWLRTGDIGSLDDRGYMQISDRTKDVIKTGGEWISSVELENEVMAHPEVVEAAVIAVPDERWSERPMVAVVVEDGSKVTPAELVAFLTDRVSRWWLPERWVFITEVPKTSVGKFDKKVLRSQHADGVLEVIEVEIPRGR